eukprot:97997-Chlamydomonas_euryale.AAC.1
MCGSDATVSGVCVGSTTVPQTQLYHAVPSLLNHALLCCADPWSSAPRHVSWRCVAPHAAPCLPVTRMLPKLQPPDACPSALHTTLQARRQCERGAALLNADFTAGASLLAAFRCSQVEPFPDGNWLLVWSAVASTPGDAATVLANMAGGGALGAL